MILDGLGSGDTVGDGRQISDIGVTGPGERRGAEGELWEREHIDVGAHRSHCGRRKAIDTKVSSIDSLNRFAEMHLDLGEAENKAGFREDRLERRRNRFGVGQTLGRQQAEQGKTEQNKKSAGGTHREGRQVTGYPCGSEPRDGFLSGILGAERVDVTPLAFVLV